MYVTLNKVYKSDATMTDLQRVAFTAHRIPRNQETTDSENQRTKTNRRGEWLSAETMRRWESVKMAGSACHADLSGKLDPGSSYDELRANHWILPIARSEDLCGAQGFDILQAVIKEVAPGSVFHGQVRCYYLLS